MKEKSNCQYCKNCGKDIPLGGNKFCSGDCKKKKRRRDQANWEKNKHRKDNYRSQTLKKKRRLSTTKEAPLDKTF